MEATLTTMRNATRSGDLNTFGYVVCFALLITGAFVAFLGHLVIGGLLALVGAFGAHVFARRERNL